MMIVLFFFLSAVCVGSVLAMILSRNPAYSPLYLVVTFVSLGGLFGLLGASFMAVVQIIIYAGAIMVLFIFVIMMINVRQGLAAEKKRLTLILSGLAGVLLLIELLSSARGAAAGPAFRADAPASSPAEIGRLLFTKYLFPFEITSLLIIAALVGAIALVKKRERT